MTELEWLNGTNPHRMLDYLKTQQGNRDRGWLSWFSFGRAQPHVRKRLLFACACCRRIERLLADSRSRYALEAPEKHADGQLNRKALKQAAALATAAAFGTSSPRLGVGGWMAVAQARAAEAVAGTFHEHDPANVTAALAKEAVRAWIKDSPGDWQDANRARNAEPSLNDSVLSRSVILSSTSGQPDAPTEGVAWATEGKRQCDCARYIRQSFSSRRNPQGCPGAAEGNNRGTFHLS